MKHLIKLLFLCLVISSGCKKDKPTEERKLVITGQNGGAFKVSIWDDHNGTGRNLTVICPGSTTYDIHPYSYDKVDVTITSDSSTFDCKATVNEKTVYHQTGKEHKLHF